MILTPRPRGTDGNRVQAITVPPPTRTREGAVACPSIRLAVSGSILSRRSRECWRLHEPKEACLSEIISKPIAFRHRSLAVTLMDEGSYEPMICAFGHAFLSSRMKSLHPLRCP